MLAVLVADCVPVMLRGAIAEGPSAGATVVAAAHAGRRGLQLGVLEAVVSRMSSMGVQPQGDQRRARAGRLRQVLRGAGVDAGGGRGRRSGGPLDRALRPAVARPARRVWSSSCTRSGVSKVKVDPTCTLESPDHFSHRRDQRTGRSAGLIVIDG